jgi:16S rRNA (guanine966-N2)-methyltransferase
VRPTREEIRADLFDRLGEEVRGFRVLDLYAGTGALGLESLSRGAKNVDFVENGAPALHALKGNVAKFRVKKWTRIFKKDVFVFLDGVMERMDGRGGGRDSRAKDRSVAPPEEERSKTATPAELPYDLVLADPPYTSKAPDRLAALWMERPFSRILCIEHPSDHPLPRPGKRRVFSDTMVTTYRHDEMGRRRKRSRKVKPTQST